MRTYTHPHPDPAHVMRVYRSAILGLKRKVGTARGLIYYHAYVNEYLAAKALIVNKEKAHG